MNPVFSFLGVSGKAVFVSAEKVTAITSAGRDAACPDAKASVWVGYADEPFRSTESVDELVARWKRHLAGEIEPIVDYRCNWTDRAGFRCGEQGSLLHQELWYCREHIAWAEADTALRQSKGGGR